MSAMRFVVVALGVTTLLGTLLAVSARTPRLPDDPRDVPRESQLNVSEVKADLDGDGLIDGVLVVNALTGDPDPRRGSEVLYAVYELAPPRGPRGALRWSRRAAESSGLPAHDGEIAAVDLDGDGRSELILTWDRSASPERVERWTEILGVDAEGALRTLWAGDWERDTRRDPETPAEAREWRRREIDFGATRKALGKALVLKRTTLAAPGHAGPAPLVESETLEVALRPVR